jgi:hypothetical protein
MADDIANIGIVVTYNDAPVNKFVSGMKSAELAQNRLNKAVRDGKISLDDGVRGLAELENRVNRLKGAMNTTSAAVEESRKGVNRWGLLVQQSGYQAGDFIVQVQSGTNAFVAFGQQATQLVGILPMFTAELGLSAVALGGITLGLSIAIPLLTAIGAYFTRTGKSAKSSADDVNTFSGAIKALTAEIQKNQEIALKAKFGTDILGIASAKQQIEDLQKGIVSLQASIDRMKSQGGKAAAFSGLVTGSLEELETQKKALQDQLNILSAQQEAQSMLNGGLSAASGLHDAIVMAKQEELRLAKEQAIAEQAAADKSTYLKNVFHAMAGEAGAVSTSLKGWAGEILNAAGAMSSLGQYMFKVNNLSGMMGRGLPAGGMPANFTPYSPSDYSGLTYGGAFAEGRMGGSSTPPKVKKTAGGGAEKKDPLAELQKQISLQEELNGKTEAEQKVRQALGDSWSNYSPVVIKGLEDQIQKQMDLEAAIKSQQQIFDTVKTSMEDAFMGIISGTESAKDAFKSMAAAIIKELYNVLVVQQLVGSFDRATGTGSGLVGMIGSALFRADGGPVSAGQPYIVGERGPEMIIPKSSGMVLTNGQTKAALGGSSNESYVVNNNISVTGSDSVMVRQEIAKMIPQISSATKAAMIDAKRRGGQMGNAFR